jgi:hypothetical protein
VSCVSHLSCCELNRQLIVPSTHDGLIRTGARSVSVSLLSKT